MHPQICQIGPFPVYSFGVMFLLALVTCSFLLSREARRYGLSSDAVYDLVFWVILAGIVGARLFFIALNLDFFVRNPGEILLLNKGGLAWQGGLVLGLLAGFLYAKRLKVPVFFLADLLAPYVALGQAIGRIGCFLNGCCYGLPAAWGVYFPVHHDRLQPTQLYDFAALFLIFAALKFSRKVFEKQGQVFAAYLILSAAARFGIEFFRADHEPFVYGLSVFQTICLALFLAGGVLLGVLQLHGAAKRIPGAKNAFDR